MQISELATGLGQGITFRRFTFTYLDLQATSGSGAKALAMFTLAAGAIIMGVRVKHSVAFAGGSLSAMTVSVGKTGSLTFFTSTQDIFQAVADTTVQETALFKHGQQTALAVVANFAPTGDNCSAATAGTVDIDVAMLVVSTDFSSIP